MKPIVFVFNKHILHFKSKLAILQYVLQSKKSSPVTTPLKNHLSDAVDEVLLI